jgi:hypothetical protein
MRATLSLTQPQIPLQREIDVPLVDVSTALLIAERTQTIVMFESPRQVRRVLRPSTSATFSIQTR